MHASIARLSLCSVRRFELRWKRSVAEVCGNDSANAVSLVTNDPAHTFHQAAGGILVCCGVEPPRICGNCAHRGAPQAANHDVVLVSG